MRQQRMINAWVWWKTSGSWRENDAALVGLGLEAGQLEEGTSPFLILQTNTHYSALANKIAKPARASGHAIWLPSLS